MTGELKKPSELEGFIDKLTLALKNELEHDLVGTKEEKVLRAVEKLYQLYAQELDKYQGKGLLHVAGERNATDLVEVLLLMGFDNISLSALLSRTQGKNWAPVLIKNEWYLETFSYNPYRDPRIFDAYFNSTNFHVDSILLKQHKPYQEHLVSIYNFMVHEEFNKFIFPSNEKNIAVIICDYIGFGSKYFRLDLLDAEIGLRNRLLKPLIDYCNSHFLDYEARQMLNKILAKEKVLKKDVEYELDILLKKQAHWNKPYTYSLLLSRINTQKQTQQVMVDAIKDRVTTVMQDTFKTTIKAQYIQDCKSYYALHQSYLACREDFLKLKNSMDTQQGCFLPGVVFSLSVLLMQLASISVLAFCGVNMAVYFTGLCFSLVIFASFIVLAVIEYNRSFDLFDWVDIPLFSCSNVDNDAKNSAPEENIELQLEQLKAHYEFIQTASLELKKQWITLQYLERSAQEKIAPIRGDYAQFFKILLGYAAVGAVALTLGIIGICLSNPMMFIGLTAGGAVSSLLGTVGLFKRVQYSVSKPTMTIDPNSEPIPRVSIG